MKKRFAITVLALALTAGSAMTSFAAGFTGTGKGVKYQWGDCLLYTSPSPRDA